MKKFLLGMTLTVFAIVGMVFAQSDLTTNTSYPWSIKYPKESIGLPEGVKEPTAAWLVYTYSIARNGGSTGVDMVENIPDNFIVWDGCVDVITPQLPATNEVTIGFNSTDDILAATTNLNSTGIKAVIPVGTAATAVKGTNDNATLKFYNTGTLTQAVFKVILYGFQSQ